jgi:outer membrane protein assembly factor BamB
LYWWPSTCDCNLTLYGITCLGPAGNFAFAPAATAAERWQSPGGEPPPSAPVSLTSADWPTFRGNERCNVSTDAVVPAAVKPLWSVALPGGVTPTAPTAAAGLAFVAGSDGVVRAIETSSGSVGWTALTGGGIRVPPTIAAGLALAGSGDGWVYAWDAATGALRWRFRAAPIERRIPIYGQLLSTWPAASGVVVHQGVAYVAAGIVNYDGTHVYALDAASGRLRWQNSSTGHLDPEARTGVSVQGHLLVHDGRLYLPGGNAVSPAVFDIRDGKCLNDPAQHLRRVHANNVPATESPRGSELYLIGNQVRVAGKPYYSHPAWPVHDGLVINKTLLTTVGDRDLLWVNNTKLVCYPQADAGGQAKYLDNWGKAAVEGLQPTWAHDCPDSAALAVGRNAAVIAGPRELVAVNLADGQPLWTQPLPAPPVPWGLALDRDGRALVTLENGQIHCFGPAGR